MPTNNNTQPALQQCSVCPKVNACPWAEFSNKLKEKYCPLLAYLAHPGQQPAQLDAFLHQHLN